jgi:hypothetical protein
MKHPIECFLGFAGLLGVEIDVVPSFSTASSVTLALYTAPDLDRFTSDGVVLWWTSAMASGQIGVRHIDSAEGAVNTESFLHDDLLISKK